MHHHRGPRSDDRPGDHAHGLLLAAGAGSRMGRPKALVVGDDGVPWVERAVRVLLDGGCDRVTVVLGAAAEQARALVPSPADVVVADGWEQGMSVSLRTGLGSLAASEAAAAVVHLVDLPDVGADVVERVLRTGVSADVLARANFFSRPGHPVLIGRDHWSACAARAHGDRGAGAFLSSVDVTAVECGDLATGTDQDGPSEPT